jgi:peptidoglycan/LPS O-acetylase OafA/YrhL
MKPASFASFDSARYFPALDGLRAVSVFMVMCNHTRAQVPAWVHGFVGVDVFFVLSGFLITTLLLRERNQYGSVSVTSFYIRRFFRIVPIYFLTILLYFVSIWATHDRERMAQFDVALPWLLTFMREYCPETAGTILGHAWTLGIEEKFYLLWPVLLLMHYPFRGRALALLAGLCAAILCFPPIFARAYGGLMLGALLAIGLSENFRPRAALMLLKLPAWLACMLVIAAYSLAGMGDRVLLLFSATIALLIASLVTRQSVLRRGLESRFAVFIGKRSYAMYLIHVLVMNAVSRYWPAAIPSYWLVVAAAGYLLTLGLSAVLYASIERPCMRWGRQLSRRYGTLSRDPIAAHTG